ncbi:MAG: hypothetical protein KF773_01820 [Deltaproteobacteria bacterium]|nr:hypothetical protein [Deltaproteobacteria bacterium]
MSVETMSAQTKLLALQVKDDMRHVLSLRERARKEKDVIKLTCVNDKLVALKAQMNIFDTLHAELAGSLERSGSERFTMFGNARTGAEEVKKTRREADGCLGESELFNQESGQVLRPEIRDDPSAIGPYFDTVEPPAYASPFN